ncbi:hypothetical protein TBR22_A14810 [Luteitalea sp. TBR-22]|uniref:DUF4234 domain-containing protein n=1 Tax=Luteitalea sp. TBR-22 TaxID=2802971 RepID=UPI001AFACE03|nr:DUF4234 domain-containing protein [Luteitalea sp. TBR-22]BCS32271.1 hypothetical protein TBR22_A14810 [Luteitalea sp. TBR-22]
MSESVIDPVPQAPAPGEVVAEPPAAAVPFFLVGVPKFVVLSLLTFGLYQLLWWYRHWVRLRDVGGEDVWPVPRTVFANVFAYFFFDRVNEEADRQLTPTLLSPPLLAVAYFVALTSGYLGAPDWVPVVAPVLLLAYAQSVINALPTVQGLPGQARNTRFTLRNVGGVVGCVVLLVLFALMSQSTPARPDADAAVSLDTVVEQLNRDLPQTVSGGLTMERVEGDAGGLVVFVRLTQVEVREAVNADVVGRAQRQLLEMACASEGIERMALDGGVPLRYTLVDKAHTAFASMHITSRAQCSALGD